MAKKITIEVNTVHVELPIGMNDTQGYQSQLVESGDVPVDVRGVHLNLNLGQKAAAAFVRFRNGLRTTNPKIDTNADALRWLFEQIADASP